MNPTWLVDYIRACKLPACALVLFAVLFALTEWNSYKTDMKIQALTDANVEQKQQIALQSQQIESLKSIIQSQQVEIAKLYQSHYDNVARINRIEDKVDK